MLNLSCLTYRDIYNSDSGAISELAVKAISALMNCQGAGGSVKASEFFLETEILNDSRKIGRNLNPIVKDRIDGAFEPNKSDPSTHLTQFYVPEYKA